MTPDSRRIRSFKDAAAFEAWLSKNHQREPELWLKIHKKGPPGLRSVTPAEALEVVLCWGWIDGLRKGFDQRSFLQRYTPRKARSIWSQVNRDNIARLTAAGRITEHGQRQVEAAKADGRWDAVNAPILTGLVDSVPADLRKAIDANLQGQEAARPAEPHEPVCAHLSHQQHEDPRRTRQEDRYPG